MTTAALPWALQSGYPILASLQLLPLLAVALVLTLQQRAVFWVAVSAAVLELLLAIDLYRQYDPGGSAMQFAEQMRLAGPLAYHAAADGMSVLFVMLNALLTLLVVIYGRVRNLQPQPRLLGLVFTVQAMLMSMLLTVDLLWFVLMSALQLLPLSYLLWFWATSPDKDLALTRFLQFMGIGVLLLLGGTLVLGWNYADATGAGWSFDLFQLAGIQLPVEIRSVTFFLLFYGLAIRTPLFPLHGWLPPVAEHGTVALSPVFLLGLKTGVYGMLRFVFPLLPDTVVQWHQFVVAFAAAGIFYAAVMALLQVNLRRLLAFAVVSHTSVLVIGLFALGPNAFQGSMLLAVNFGLAISGLAFVTGMIYLRTRSMLLSRLGGLFDRLPLLGIAFLVAGLAIVGMPGTPGFDAVHLVLEDAMQRFGALVTIAAALGNVVAAGFLLLAFQRAFLAPVHSGQEPPAIPRASFQERLIAIIVVLVLLGTGFFLEPWLDLVEPSARGLSAAFRAVPVH